MIRLLLLASNNRLEKRQTNQGRDIDAICDAISLNRSIDEEEDDDSLSTVNFSPSQFTSAALGA
jgi:hypothetical protein